MGCGRCGKKSKPIHQKKRDIPKRNIIAKPKNREDEIAARFFGEPKNDVKRKRQIEILKRKGLI